nr:NPCBM/NEW2 domain-containing protein [Cohnella sp. WQ 127256]
MNVSVSADLVTAREIQSVNVVSSVMENRSNTASIQVASVAPFALHGQEILTTYNTVYKMDRANIKSITNNGGNYPNSAIDKAIDGNMNTHWETGKPNASGFTNEVVFVLNESTLLNRIVYAARQSTAQGKGFAQQFEVYSSSTAEGDNFTLVSTGEYKGSTGDVVAIQFAPAQFKRIKFVFTKANQDWASAAEFAFYKEDLVTDAVNGLFTDGTMSAVVSEYNSVDKINALAAEAMSHPLYPQLKDQLDLANRIVSGEAQMEGTIITAEQHGNMKQHAQQNLRFGLGTNNQPTGFVAMPGDKINVYVDVDVDSKDKLPSLVFSQQEGSWSSWTKGVSLRPGKNTITVPEIPTNSAYAFDVTKGGTVYVVNPYTPAEQGKAPSIRFEGLERFPMMTKDTDVEQFKAFLTAYKQRVDQDKAAHPNVKERELIDVVEMVSDRIIFTGTATDAYNQFITKGHNPMDTLTGYDVWMEKLFDFYGLDGRSVNHDPKQIRENIRLMQPYGFMYAAGDHTGIQRGEVGLLLADFSKTYPGWGMTHEIGHRMAVGEREYGEITNNMLSMAMSVDYNSLDNRIPFESDIYKYVIEENKVVMDQQGLGARLGTYWQLELAYPGYWKELNSLYRDRKVTLTNGDNSKQQYLIEFSSEVLGLDLSSFFARHGFTVNAETREKVSKYPTSNKLWYLNNSVVNYEGTGIEDKNASIEVGISRNVAAKSNTLSFTIDQVSKKDLLGYEVYRDGKLVGFTGTDGFVDQGMDTNTNYTYQIVGYDKKLNTLNPVEIKAFKPALSVEDQITIKLNQSFDPIHYVKATSYQGNDITSEVAVTFNNVDVTKKGSYEVGFEIKSGGAAVSKTANVTVASNYAYVSDLTAKSVRVGWKSLMKDKAPAGGAITLVRQGQDAIYTKGIGVHANSEVVYDIAGKGYDSFESYIGIDQSMRGSASSATFEIYVDGEKKWASDVFKSNTEHGFVKIPVTGATEIKLVTTDANNNGNTADHTVWADAKFLIQSSAPELTIPKSISTKVGQPIPFQESYFATDIEDGDITSQIVVTGEEQVNFNRAGEYTITYTVADSDGNTVAKTRTVAVVNMEDYKYLTDDPWTSTQNSYAAPKKDISISDNALRLTDDNGKEVTYARGIGTHSNSTIVYDLSGKNVDYFTSFVGVDRQMHGSVGSVSFEVYVDGEKKFDSGLMNSRDPQKWIEVDINGAKQLKLVVTDGGNGNGSDHATWGDSKLHFANAERLFTNDLERAIEDVRAMDQEGYTSESIETLLMSITQAEGVLANQVATQVEVDGALVALNAAKDGLVKIDFTQVIAVKDKYLSDSIKTTLGLTGDITLGDMHKLTTLSSDSRRARSLEGLEYAKNLVSLDITGNEITDFSPLRGLTKLDNLMADPQVVEVRELKGPVVEVDNLVTGIDGNKVIPYLAVVRHNKTYKETLFDVSGWVVNPDKFTIDLTNEAKGYYTLLLAYRVEGNLIQLIYMADNE